MEDNYIKYQFAKINSATNETVNGKSAVKFDLSINNNEAAKYENSLSGLSIIKGLEACSGSSTQPSTLGITGESGTTPLTVIVDKSTKRIIGVDGTSTSSGSSGSTSTVQSSLSYSPVTITAPTGAEPITSILPQLESALGTSTSGTSTGSSGLGSILGGSASSSGNGTVSL